MLLKTKSNMFVYLSISKKNLVFWDRVDFCMFVIFHFSV